MSLSSSSFTLKKRSKSQPVTVCSSPKRVVCLKEDVSKFVLNNDLGEEYLYNGTRESLENVSKNNSLLTDFYKNIGNFITSFKVMAPISLVLNIIIIAILHSQDSDSNQKVNSCGHAQYKKIKNKIFWLNTLASMNLAFSLILTILSHNITLSTGLGRFFAIVLLLFNVTQTFFAVQLQIHNNKDGCQTKALLPFTWLLPMGLVVYIIFLFIQSKDLRSKGEKLFDLL